VLAKSDFCEQSAKAASDFCQQSVQTKRCFCEQSVQGIQTVLNLRLLC